MIRLGADGCRAGWVWMSLGEDPGHLSFGVAASVSDLLAEVGFGSPGSRDAVLVDMPIGLLPQGMGARACDREARRLLTRARSSSVFPVPARAALAARDYPEAQALNRAAVGKGLSKQAWFLVPRIREVDHVLRERASLRGRIREAHPEVCFCGLAGRPMAHGKKTAQGRAERLEVLDAAEAGLGPAVEAALAELVRPGVASDDVVDAAVLALCARNLESCRTLPESPPLDGAGLPMEMVYWPREVES